MILVSDIYFVQDF